MNGILKFSKRRYFEAETSVLESLDDIKDEHEVIFSNLEDELYDKIEGELGRYLDGSDEYITITWMTDNFYYSSVLETAVILNQLILKIKLIEKESLALLLSKAPSGY